MEKEIDGVKIDRDLEEGKYDLLEITDGLEDSEATDFLEETEVSLEDIEVIIEEGDEKYGIFYMFVDDSGILHINLDYWKTGQLEHLYMDLIHEIVHIKQLKEGRDIRDESQDYHERSTEIEAYEISIEEARRVGISEDHIKNHFNVPWITDEEYEEMKEKLLK